TATTYCWYVQAAIGQDTSGIFRPYLGISIMELQVEPDGRASVFVGQNGPVAAAGYVTQGNPIYPLTLSMSATTASVTGALQLYGNCRQLNDVNQCQNYGVAAAVISWQKSAQGVTTANNQSIKLPGGLSFTKQSPSTASPAGTKVSMSFSWS